MITMAHIRRAVEGLYAAELDRYQRVRQHHVYWHSEACERGPPAGMICDMPRASDDQEKTSCVLRRLSLMRTTRATPAHPHTEAAHVWRAPGRRRPRARHRAGSLG
jgi:hypothetical protein